MEGYNGPFFFDSLQRLQQLIGGLKLEGLTLEKAGELVTEFLNITKPKTEDGTNWFWSANFKLNNSEIALLFPYCQDWNEQDGTIADQHVALYIKGPVVRTAIDRLIVRYTTALELAANYFPRCGCNPFSKNR